MTTPVRRLLWMLITVTLATPGLAADTPGPVAAWNCDEGQGSVVHDTSGKNHGRIHGAEWVAAGAGHALRFDGVDDHVDCGNDPSLDLRGPLTLIAWVHPDKPAIAEPGVVGKFFETYALTYYKTGSCYLYISSGGNNVNGSVTVGQWSHVAGVFDGRAMRFYVNGRETSSRKSGFPAAKPGGRFRMGCVVGDRPGIDESTKGAAHFAGMIDGVRVYDRALSRKEILLDHNREAAAKGQPEFDTSRFGQLSLRKFVYPNRGEVVAEVNYEWVHPLPAGARVRAELVPASAQTATQTVTVEPKDGENMVEATLPAAGLANGVYMVRATVEDADGRALHTARNQLRLPLPDPDVPSPADRCVGALPAVVKPPKYECRLAPGGGFTVTIGDRSFPVESTFSYPHGGENVLSVTPSPAGAEPEWKVTTEKADARTYTVRAGGRHYAIDRRIKLTASRIEVEDTITNKTDDVVGVIFSNHINTRGQPGAHRSVYPNATVFVSVESAGLGLVALDDLYHLQQRTDLADGCVAIRDEHFGLDGKASYTFRWAAYPTASNDYYDFINQIRTDENLKGTVEGGFAFTSSFDVESWETVEAKSLKYLSWGSLTRVMHNPTISLEGWEFLDYPKFSEKLKTWISETKRAHPGLKVGFHVAHALYATNRPKELFPDSLAIHADGKINCYGPSTMAYYGKYFSKELVDDGWRWWLFYPTTTNSFGKRMLEAADYMIEELGATVIWADGYISGYIRGGYTYDLWDGHSVTIDPNTKIVTRKKANVTYIAMPVLKAVARKFSDSGGVLITNGKPGPLSFQKENVIASAETSGGDQQPVSMLHLARTVTPLGSPRAIKTKRDVYRDILGKLDMGALYFWYGERDFVTEETIVAHMYPITFESIHAGTVRGKERIVTKNSGVYGWPGDRSLHAVYPYDARGRLGPNHHLTTVDAGETRTELTLGKNEAAVVVRIPVKIDASGPVNLIVREYDAGGVSLLINGRGDVRFRMRDGKLSIARGSTYRIEAGGKSRDIVAGAVDLEFTVTLAGATRVEIKPRSERSP